MEIDVESAPIDPQRRLHEVVERKGLGHPDTLCDRAAEAFSRALSRRYLDQTGHILHHNVDKALLSAGETRVRYGGGEWIEPMTFILAGRATAAGPGGSVSLEELARGAVDEAVAPIRNLDREFVRVRVEARPGAPDLVDLFERAETGAVPLANDTSIGVGFAPRSRVEQVALEVERRLNAPETKLLSPAVGEDVKVMAVRRRDSLHLTVAAAMVAGFVENGAAYRRAVEQAASIASEVASELGFEDCSVAVNAGDEIGRTEYLTLSGTSAEAGDDGQVGRGNRVGGLITPMRPMTLEAFAGKNPVTHVGKLYSLTASAVAEACAELDGVRTTECLIVSRIGSPITQPQSVALRIDAAEETAKALCPEIEAVVSAELERLPTLWKKPVLGDPDLSIVS